MAKGRGRIRLWELGSGLPAGEIRSFLQDTFGPACAVSAPKRLVPDEKLPGLARALARWRIADAGRLGLSGGKPSRRELDGAVGVLSGASESSERLAARFSGIGLASSLSPHIPSAFDCAVDIVLTAALPLMWEPADCKWHARALVCASPSIISTTGAVEGPARPRGYYVAKMMGLSDEEARKKYIGRYLEHGDPRLPEVAKGLAAQAVFYGLTGQPFCEKESCRLFNARWQEQLVESQLRSGKFCDQHNRFLKGLRRA